MMNAKNILVVEDEASIAEEVSLYLKRAGYNVQIAYDGKQAMGLFERGQVDFVILDLMLPEVDPFMHIPVDFWRKVMDVNITGNFLMCRAIMPEMATQKKGVVLNIGSTIWLYPKLPLLAYITGKAALVGFTRCIAADPLCIESNIRVNCLMPGGTWDQATIGLLGNVPGAEEAVVGGQIIKRREMPEDLVGPMLFLITDESGCMSGNAVAADMGLTVW